MDQLPAGWPGDHLHRIAAATQSAHNMRRSIHQSTRRLPDLIRCLQDVGPPIRQVGLEAGNLSHYIAARLTEVGYIGGGGG